MSQSCLDARNFVSPGYPSRVSLRTVLRTVLVSRFDCIGGTIANIFMGINTQDAALSLTEPEQARLDNVASISKYRLKPKAEVVSITQNQNTL